MVQHVAYREDAQPEDENVIHQAYEDMRNDQEMAESAGAGQLCNLTSQHHRYLVRYIYFLPCMQAKDLTATSLLSAVRLYLFIDNVLTQVMCMCYTHNLHKHKADHSQQLFTLAVYALSLQPRQVVLTRTRRRHGIIDNA
jgi:hypothetical protein